jgi:hypothetical protein
MIILPNHYATLPAATQAAGPSQDALPSEVPPPSASQPQERAQKAPRTLATSARHPRTHEQPASVGTRKSTRIRRAPTRHKAQSIRAPYAPMTPIVGVDAMEVDGDEDMYVSLPPATEISKEVTLVSLQHRCESFIQDSHGA